MITIIFRKFAGELVRASREWDVLHFFKTGYPASEETLVSASFSGL